MINRLTLVISFILIFTLFNINTLGKEYDLTPSQKHFTIIIKQLPTIIHADWESPVTLWVRASSKSIGSPPDPTRAKQLADVIAERGRSALRQPFCVHIYQKKGTDIARSCVY